jgi:hypothetical protein
MHGRALRTTSSWNDRFFTHQQMGLSVANLRPWSMRRDVGTGLFDRDFLAREIGGESLRVTDH